MRSFFICNLKRMLILLVIIAGVIIGKESFGQTRESLIKAGYIEKFTHFVKWPATISNIDSAETFIISIIGRNTFGNDLNELFSKVKINNKIVRINYISSIEEIKNSKVLFISESEEMNLDKIINYAKNKPILTISDSKGFGEKGVLINMFTEDNYIRYELNRTTLEKSGLKINSLLLNYAVIIKSDG